MRNHKTRLLLAALFSFGLTGTALCADLPAWWKDTREVDFVLSRQILVNFSIQTYSGSGNPQRLEIPWIRIEPVYGNAWSPTACIGWSPAADSTWQIGIELLDDKGNVLKHSRDRPTVFTCKTTQENPDMMRYVEVSLDPIHWENRRHVAKIRLILEPARDPMANLPLDGSASLPLVVCAIDKDDKPIEDAAVIAKTTHYSAPYRSHTFLYRTDSRGECRVDFEKADLRSASVTIQKPKYATVQKSWSGPYISSLSDLPLTDLPERHVMKMPPTQTIGGIVEDEAGKPIADVQVRIQAHLEETGGVASVSRSILTDKRGRWRIDEVPAEAEVVSLGFKHRDYISDTWANRQIRGNELSSLHDRMHTATMKRGLAVSGRVLDDQGRPVSRAAVILAPAQNDRFQYEHACTLSDADGKFRFDCADNDRTDTMEGGGSTGVLVEMPGYVPVMQRVVVEPNLAPLEFRLSRGHPLHVRVVDANDRPIAGASTVVDALTEDRSYGFWLDDTDDQGRVQIPHAPDREVLFTAMQDGYVSVRDHALAASSDEQVVKMKPSPRIQGTVRDARTGELIREFALSVLQVTDDRIITEDPIRLKEGRFDLTFDELRAADLQLRVLALGYKPTTSESIRPEGSRAMEFKLEADPSFDAQALRQAIGGPDRLEPVVITGVVLDPNGGAVPKAAINIYPPSGSETIANAEGKFKLRCPPGGFGRTMAMSGPMGTLTPYILVRNWDRNLAAAVEFDETVRENLKISLVPGVVLSGKVTDAQGKAIPGAKLSLIFWPGQMGFSMRDEPAAPDPNGRYEIRAVPAGHRFSVNATAQGYGRESVEARTDGAVNNRMDLEPMSLKPANLDISGVVVDGNDQPVRGVNVVCFGRGQPSNPPGKTDAQGRFTIRGVCAGTAQVQANIMEGKTRLVGQVQTEGGASDVKIVVSSRMTAGRFVPAKPPSLVGKPLPSLADVGFESAADSAKDQAILLCLFDMNQRPSRNAVLQLAKRVDELKQKGVTLIVVQAADADAVALEQWVKDQGLAIPIGSLKTDVKKATFAWGVQSLPWLILTDKSHTVTAAGFSIGDLDGILAKNGGQ